MTCFVSPFAFVPFDEERPRDGTVVRIEVRSPRYEAERAAFEAVLARNPFAEDEPLETLAPTMTTAPEDLLRPDEVCLEDGRVTLVVGYPFPGQYAVTVIAPTPRGFTRVELFRAIVRVHHAMYEGATLERPSPKLYNTRVESPRFGVARHKLEDLVIEEVLIARHPDANVYAWVSIGS